MEDFKILSGTYRETVRKVERLHQWDVARANKAPFAFGIEPRVPFLDKAFLAVSMSIDPQDKMVRPSSLPIRLPDQVLFQHDEGL